MSLDIGLAGYASQRLSQLLTQFLPAQTASSDTASTASLTSTINAAASATTPTDTSLTGSTQPSLSSQILATLMQMQSGSGTSSSQSIDPLQNLFTAMDADGDGTVSQSEMESYLEKAGGTQAQADALYSAVDTNGANGITESQLGAALPTQGQMAGLQGGHHHHHHHHAQGSSSTSPVDTLMQAIDSNGDGQISQDELTSFVTANGGTSDQATSDFNALASNGATSISSSDLSKAWETLQQSQSGNWGGPVLLSMLNAFAGSSSASATSTVATA